MALIALDAQRDKTLPMHRQRQHTLNSNKMSVLVKENLNQ
jgi:hypothetical protein